MTAVTQKRAAVVRLQESNADIKAGRVYKGDLRKLLKKVVRGRIVDS